MLDSKEALVFARIHLEFQFELLSWVGFGCEAKREMNGVACLFSLAGSKPRENVANGINDWPVRFWL
jgi:hypothetical protein